MNKFRNPTQEEVNYLKYKFKITWKILGRSFQLIASLLILLFGTMSAKGIWLIIISLIGWALLIHVFYRVYLLVKIKGTIKKGDYKLVKAECTREEQHDLNPNKPAEGDNIVYYTFKDENGKKHKTSWGTDLLHFYARFYHFGMIKEGDELYIIKVNNKIIYFKIK